MSKSKRRKFLLASGALLVAPLVSFAQSAQKMRRIGLLTHISSESPHAKGMRRLLLDSLRRVGYEEGRNLVIEWRFAEDKVERLPGLAEELIKLNVELIVAYRNEAIVAAKRATQTIPIVMAVSLAPVENRLVASLARPGGNITGTTWTVGQRAKLYQLLKEALPKAKRVTLLWDPKDINSGIDVDSDTRGAAANGWILTRVELTRPGDLKSALDQIVASRADALVITGNLIIQSRMREIAEFALQRKLVWITDSSTNFAFGGVLYYGPTVEDVWIHTARYVDQILRGAKPADLPVEEPSKWELLLNAKTARAIGFKPPPSFMVRVDKQVE